LHLNILYFKRIKSEIEEFRHALSPLDDSMTCVRCRPLVYKPRRKIVKSEFRHFSADKSISLQSESSEYNISNELAVFDTISVEEAQSAYLNRLGVLPSHFTIKNHIAFPEIGTDDYFYGCPPIVVDEFDDETNLKSYNPPSFATGRKRKNYFVEKDVHASDDDEYQANYPLLHKVKAEKETLKN